LQLNEWPPGKLLPSTRQLAEHYKASQRSIRRAIAQLQTDGRISIQPRKRPQVIADNTLETMMHGSLAIVMTSGLWSSLQSLVNRPIVYGLASAAQRKGIPLLMLHDNDRWRSEFPAGLRKLPISGVILVGPSFKPAVLRQYENLQLPVVLLDRPGDEWNFNSIAVDNYSAAYDAASRLSRLGHRNIALVRNIVSEAVDPDDKERIAGSRAALSAKPEFHVRVFSAAGSSYERLPAEIINSVPRFTAIITSSPRFADVALKACLKVGIRVPQDLSIVAFRTSEKLDIDWSGPQIDFFAMARRAIQIISEQTSEPRHIRIAPIWNAGQTIGPPNRSLTMH
jgi:DNA-binding LacI/PurR family transcriptional regulator